MANNFINQTLEYPTNFSNGTSVIDLGTFVQYMNYVTGEWFAYGFLMLVFAITFVSSMVLGSRKALLASSFISLVFSVYFLRLDMLNPVLTFIFLVGIVIGALGAKEGGGNY